jgi:GTP-binding protein
MMEEVLRVYEKWNTRISTALLNKWIRAFCKVQRMPSEDGKFLKIRYLMQVKTRPPSFYLYVNDRHIIKENYLKFIRHSIIKEFGLQGVPVRILVRDTKLVHSRRGGSLSGSSFYT